MWGGWRGSSSRPFSFRRPRAVVVRGVRPISDDRASLRYNVAPQRCVDILGWQCKITHIFLCVQIFNLV